MPPKYRMSRPAPEPAPVDGARWIPLTKGRFALVDEQDFERVDKWNWSLKTSKGDFEYAYRRDTELGPLVLQRFILDCHDDNYVVDHVNHNTLDNRRANLRICKTRDNNRNVVKMKKSTTSKYKGVYFEAASNKWKAQIGVDGRRVTLGRFSTQEEAAQAYNSAARKFFGEFSLENKIQ